MFLSENMSRIIPITLFLLMSVCASVFILFTGLEYARIALTQKEKLVCLGTPVFLFLNDDDCLLNYCCFVLCLVILFA